MEKEQIKEVKFESIVEGESKPTSMEAFVKDISQLQKAANELIRKVNAGLASQGDLIALMEKEESLLREFRTFQEEYKAAQLAAKQASGSGFGDVWVPSAERVEQITKVFEIPDDLKGINPVYYGVMSLRTEELLGVAAVGARGVPGYSAIVRNWEQYNSNTAANINRLKQLNDALIVKETLLARCHKPYQNRSHSPAERMKTLREWKEYERLWNEMFSRAASLNLGTSNAPAPTIMSSRIGDLLEVYGRVVPLFPRIPITSKSFEWPFQASHMTVYLPGEGANDDQSTGTITASTVTFNKPTWTPVKLAALTYSSTELDEDSVEPMIPWLEAECARVMNRGNEDAIVNGDTTNGTLDGTGFNPSGQVKRAWNGLRSHALLTSSYGATNTAGSADVTDALMINTLGKMNQWGVDPAGLAWICQFVGYASLRSLPSFLTMEKVGNRAVVLNGQVGEAYGSPVVVSDLLPLTHTDGKVNATPSNNTHGTILAVARNRYFIAERRAIDVAISEHVAFKNDQVAIRVTQRLDFKPVDTPTGSTITPVGIIYNIK